MTTTKKIIIKYENKKNIYTLLLSSNEKTIKDQTEKHLLGNMLICKYFGVSKAKGHTGRHMCHDKLVANWIRVLVQARPN